jgi:hypothetical protein
LWAGHSAQFAIEGAQRVDVRLSVPSRGEAIGEPKSGSGAKQGEGGGNDFAILYREVPMIRQHLDRGRLGRRAHVVSTGQNLHCLFRNLMVATQAPSATKASGEAVWWAWPLVIRSRT